MKAQSDVQSEKSSHFTDLDWVGMTQIQSSIQMKDSDRGLIFLPTCLDIGVSLKENYRGIHMSRLYRLHQELFLKQPLSEEMFLNLANQGLSSQADISDFFSCRLALQWPKKTMSLKSELSGFRNYKIEIIFEKKSSENHLFLQFEVIYSSTCPQSAGLSMEVLKQSDSSAVERLPATPHAQRSRAVIQVKLHQINQDLIDELITQTEIALGTPVQTTVKKEDEMQFAKLNAENLMFCEDAARKISDRLKTMPQVEGYSIFCEHQESLHPHNATSLKKYHYQGPQKLQFS